MDAAANLYESFEPRQDSYFFRVGVHGLVSFHGRNYNIKKRMSAEQTSSLTQDATFVRVASDCYINVNKVTAIVDDHVYFGERTIGVKRLSVSRRTQQLIRNRLSD